MEWWRGYRMTYGEVENLPLSLYAGHVAEQMG